MRPFLATSGINAGSDVRLAGVKVGSVQAVGLDAESYEAKLTLNITTDLPIPDDSAVAISQEGLLGGSFVEIIPGGSEFFMQAGDQFFDTQGSVSLLSLLLKFATQAQQ